MSPNFLNNDYGKISPKNKITTVDDTNPTIPPAASDINIEKSELTDTFPIRMVHSNRFPLFLNGSSFFAYYASLSSYLFSNGPIVNSSRYLVSKLMTPRFNPAKSPDRMPKTAHITIFHHSIVAFT